MEVRIKVICIDDSNRPDGIPISKWVKKDQFYTVIQISKLPIQGNILGVKLLELNIDDCFPYTFFAANRFAIPTQSQMWADETLERIKEEAQKEYKEEAI